MAWNEEIERIQRSIDTLINDQLQVQLQIDEFDAVMRKYAIMDTSLGYFSLLSNEILEMIFTYVVITRHHFMICKGISCIISRDAVYKNTFYKTLKFDISIYAYGAFEKYIKPLSGESYYTWSRAFRVDPNYEIKFANVITTITIRADIISKFRSSVILAPVTITEPGDVIIMMAIPNTNFINLFTLCVSGMFVGIFYWDGHSDILDQKVGSYNIAKFSTYTNYVMSSSIFMIDYRSPSVTIKGKKFITIILPAKSNMCVICGEFDNGLMIPDETNQFMFKKYIKKLIRGKIMSSNRTEIIARMCGNPTGCITSFKEAVEHWGMETFGIHVYIPEHYDFIL